MEALTARLQHTGNVFRNVLVQLPPKVLFLADASIRAVTPYRGILPLQRLLQSWLVVLVMSIGLTMSACLAALLLLPTRHTLL